MPDHRTIYTTDDGSNGVLTMFRADKPADLTSGGVQAQPLNNSLYLYPCIACQLIASCLPVVCQLKVVPARCICLHVGMTTRRVS